MKRYRLNKKNDKKLSEEEILRFKSFSQLQQQYEKVTKRPSRPLYKNPVMFFVLVLIILLALLLAGELGE